MAMNFDYDFSGWATKANTKCYDGLTIAPNAFAGDNGKKVPVVWNHNHSGILFIHSVPSVTGKHPGRHLVTYCSPLRGMSEISPISRTSAARSN